MRGREGSITTLSIYLGQIRGEEVTGRERFETKPKRKGTGEEGMYCEVEGGREFVTEEEESMGKEVRGRFKVEDGCMGRK